MKDLIIIGASGHGKVCTEIAEATGRYGDIVFLDDDRNLKSCGRYPVVGVSDDVARYLSDDVEFFVSIGNSGFRSRIQDKVLKVGGRIATLVHPDSTVSPSAILGDGVAIMAGSVINADARIGDGVIVNTCSSIDHDCTIGDYCHVAVGAHVCGTVSLGSHTWIGAGAIISNNLSICDNCLIGVGAVVVSDIEVPGTYVGVPVRRRCTE